MLDNFDDVLTVDELCSILMIGRNTAYRILNENIIPAFRIGKCWKIPKCAVIDYLKHTNHSKN